MWCLYFCSMIFTLLLVDQLIRTCCCARQLLLFLYLRHLKAEKTHVSNDSLRQGRPWILSHTLESRRSGPKDVSGPLFFLGCEVARHSNSNQIGTTKGQTSWPENFLVAALNRVENPVFAGPRHTSLMRCRPLAAASFADWLQAFGHSYASYANGRI